MSDEIKLEKLDFDALYDDKNFGECPSCGEDHVLCPVCGVCLKYCHDDYFHDPGGPYDSYDPMYFPED